MSIASSLVVVPPLIVWAVTNSVAVLLTTYVLVAGALRFLYPRLSSGSLRVSPDGAEIRLRNGYHRRAATIRLSSIEDIRGVWRELDGNAGASASVYIQLGANNSIQIGPWKSSESSKEKDELIAFLRELKTS